MGAMARAKTVLDKMIAAMNRGGDAAKRAILTAKETEMFVKPKPKKARALKKSPLPVRANVSSKRLRSLVRRLLRKIRQPSRSASLLHCRFPQHRASFDFQMIATLLLPLGTSECTVGEVLLCRAVSGYMNRKFAA